MEQLVVVVHLGSYECCDGGTMIVVRGMNRLPDGVHNMCGGSDILFVGGQLEVAHLTVEDRRHLSRAKGMGKLEKSAIPKMRKSDDRRLGLMMVPGLI